MSRCGPRRVKGAGITRGLLRTPVDPNVIDTFEYVDPNVPCGQYPVASWNLIEKGPIHLWAPRRTEDHNTPQLDAVAPDPVPPDPEKPPLMRACDPPRP